MAVHSINFIFLPLGYLYPSRHEKEAVVILPPEVSGVDPALVINQPRRVGLVPQVAHAGVAASRQNLTLT